MATIVQGSGGSWSTSMTICGIERTVTFVMSQGRPTLTISWEDSAGVHTLHGMYACCDGKAVFSFAKRELCEAGEEAECAGEVLTITVDCVGCPPVPTIPLSEACCPDPIITLPEVLYVTILNEDTMVSETFQINAQPITGDDSWSWHGEGFDLVDAPFMTGNCDKVWLVSLGIGCADGVLSWRVDFEARTEDSPGFICTGYLAGIEDLDGCEITRPIMWSRVADIFGSSCTHPCTDPPANLTVFVTETPP